MIEATESRQAPAARSVSLPRLLWPVLAIGYLAASASGQRAIALAIVGLMTGVLLAASGRRTAGAITGFVLAGACLYWSSSLSFVVYLPPIAGFAFMAYFFGRTLRPGSEPLIARMARKEHPDLPIEIARYTRALTWTWTGCFAFLLVAAVSLAPILALHAWSRWVQVLGVVLPVGLFLGEYAFRHHHLRNHRHASLPALLLNSIAVIKDAAIQAPTRQSGMLPLTRYRTTEEPLLLHPGGAITVATFLAQARTLASALPDTRHVINLCETRHGFMLGFAAALLRGQTSLFPSGQGRGDWQQVRQQFPQALLLSDKPLAGDDCFDISSYVSPHVSSSASSSPSSSVGPSPASKPAQAQAVPLVDENLQAAILFTSGSTGQPTAHAKTWGQLCHGAQSLASALGWQAFPACAIVGSIPPQHMFGLETTVMLPWMTGVPVHAQKPLLPADLDNVLRQSARPGWWMTTPMHLRPPLHALRGLAGIVASTMSLPVDTARAAEAMWTVPVMEIYGSTETGALAVRRTAAENAWAPLNGVSLRQEDEKTWASGPHVTPAGAAVMLGDELKLRADGRFHWIGRSTDLIKVGGKRASLSALNQHLANIPGVEDGVYFSPAEDEDDAAHRMAAFYVSTTLSPQDVLAALRPLIDPVFLPRPLYRVAQLPRNATGKLPQAALAQLFAQCRLQKQLPMPMTITIPADHPALPGHFPGNPIVPGVVILARVAEAVARAFPQVELGALLNARFHAPLKPGEAFCVEPQVQDDRIRFKVRLADSDTLVASGQWQCGATQAQAAESS